MILIVNKPSANSNLFVIGDSNLDLFYSKWVSFYFIIVLVYSFLNPQYENGVNCNMIFYDGLFLLKHMTTIEKAISSVREPLHFDLHSVILILIL